MEIDSGASLSVASEKTFNKIKESSKDDVQLHTTNVRLKTYTGEIVKTGGLINRSNCEFKSKERCEITLAYCKSEPAKFTWS